MICLKCKQEIANDAKFCVKCGYKIPRCPKCGTLITKKAIHFCLKDGTAIPDEILLSIPEPEQESKTIVSKDKGTAVIFDLSADLSNGENDIEDSDNTKKDEKKLADVSNENASKVSESVEKKVTRKYCVKCGKICTNGEVICDDCKQSASSAKYKEPLKNNEDATKIKYCVKCGKPCKANETLCEQCKTLPQKKNKRLRNVLVFPIILILLGVGVIVAVAAYNHGLHPIKENDVSSSSQSQYEEETSAESSTLEEEEFSSEEETSAENSTLEEEGFSNEEETSTENSILEEKESSSEDETEITDNSEEETKTSDSDKNDEETTASEETEPSKEEVAEKKNSTDTNTPFYGIWSFASKDYNEVLDKKESMESKLDIEGVIVISSEWSNLNSETWYCLSVGRYSTENEAKKALPDIQKAYSDAYIKYTGDYMKK